MYVHTLELGTVYSHMYGVTRVCPYRLSPRPGWLDHGKSDFSNHGRRWEGSKYIVVQAIGGPAKGQGGMCPPCRKTNRILEGKDEGKFV